MIYRLTDPSIKTKLMDLLALILASALVACAVAACHHLPTHTAGDARAISVSKVGFDGAATAFVPQKNYVAMPLPFALFSAIHAELSKRLSQNLITRGEAHVTVLTPPEYDALKAHLSIDAINKIALAHKIQSAQITPLCVGRGEALVEGHAEQTYFVVVDAPELLAIRRDIAKAFVTNGGAGKLFEAANYHPHVTVGFTKRDLFEQDGVIKSLHSCAYPIQIEP